MKWGIREILLYSKGFWKSSRMNVWSVLWEQRHCGLNCKNVDGQNILTPPQLVYYAYGIVSNVFTLWNLSCNELLIPWWWTKTSKKMCWNILHLMVESQHQEEGKADVIENAIRHKCKQNIFFVPKIVPFAVLLQVNDVRYWMVKAAVITHFLARKLGGWGRAQDHSLIRHLWSRQR